MDGSNVWLLLGETTRLNQQKACLLKKTNNPRGLIVAEIQCTLSSGIHFREVFRENTFIPTPKYKYIYIYIYKTTLYITIQILQMFLTFVLKRIVLFVIMTSKMNQGF